ncbi:MAG: LysR family transcriptional regulator [Alphaproteobacteria bacterium]|nr:LysR family transcriptional regulator [Alphaproteobacteria bacterium]
MNNIPTPNESLRLLRTLDWNLLYLFFVLVEQESFSKTAEKMFLTQPAVSNAIKRLESQLECELIDRSSRSLQLTYWGKKLHEETIEIHGTLLRFANSLHTTTEVLSGHINLCLVTHTVCSIFDDTLSEFHKQHPKATYSIEIVTSELVVKQVKAKTATLGICLMNEKKTELKAELFYQERFGLFCGNKHSLFKKSNISINDIKNETSVSFPTDTLSGPLKSLFELRAAVNISQHKVGTSANLEEVQRMIMANLGIGPLPIHVAQQKVDQGLLRQLPPYKDVPLLDVYLISNPKARLTETEQHFINLLRTNIDKVALKDRIL